MQYLPEFNAPYPEYVQIFKFNLMKNYFRPYPLRAVYKTYWWVRSLQIRPPGLYLLVINYASASPLKYGKMSWMGEGIFAGVISRDGE
jgi:hypothetical protein